MDQYKQRVLDEKAHLDEKIGKLTEFIGTSVVFAGLDSGEQKRLERQREVMQEYSNILEERISAFN